MSMRLAMMNITKIMITVDTKATRDYDKVNDVLAISIVVFVITVSVAYLLSCCVPVRQRSHWSAFTSLIISSIHKSHCRRRYVKVCVSVNVETGVATTDTMLRNVKRRHFLCSWAGNCTVITTEFQGFWVRSSCCCTFKHTHFTIHRYTLKYTNMTKVYILYQWQWNISRIKKKKNEW